MEITVKELFDLFTSRLGHKVKSHRQEEWRNSPEGWDSHALGHMKYWIFKDVQKMSHSESLNRKEDENKTTEELSKEIFNVLMELDKRTLANSTPTETTKKSTKINKFAENTNILDLYNLGERNFKNASLKGAKLNAVNLRGANLNGANLQDADLTNADLSDSNLINTNLSGTNLQGTDLRGAELDEVIIRNIMTLQEDDMRSSLGHKMWENLGRLIWGNIQKTGIHINVFDDEDNDVTCYSVGASALGLPEILINGFHPKQASVVINCIFNLMKNGENIKLGKVIQIFEGKSQVILKPVTSENIVDITTFADWFAKRSPELLVFQAIIPDTQGLFPWEKGFDSNYSQHFYCQNPF